MRRWELPSPETTRQRRRPPPVSHRATRPPGWPTTRPATHPATSTIAATGRSQRSRVSLESTSGRRPGRALRCYPPVSKTMTSKLPGAQRWRTCTSNDGESRASGLYVNGDTHEVCTEAKVREAFTTDVTQLPVSGCDGLILSLRSTTSERRHRPSITIRVTPRQRRPVAGDRQRPCRAVHGLPPSAGEGRRAEEDASTASR